jgi:hypothetical protein
MIRNLKALGLSLVALFAMSAIGASSASAVDVLTVGTGTNALVTGVGQTHEIEYEPNGITFFQCTTAKFAATVQNGDSVTTVDVKYEGTLNETPHNMADCNSDLGEMLVDTTGCGYQITGETTGSDPNGSATKDATIWVHCEGENKIKITRTNTNVVVTVPPQTPTKGGVVYTNVPNHDGNHAVNIRATVTGVTASCAPTFTCTLGGLPHHSNIYKYTGDVTMTAYEDRTPKGITPAEEGARTSLTWS